jgi:geranylgeranyl reductase family protein
LSREGYDVIVVGAGPAGATLAYELAKRGIEVLILEKEKLPRYKACAGGVTAKAARLLEFDISDVAEDVIYQVSFTFDADRAYVRKQSQPLIYTVTRDAFDHLLTRRAQQLGAVLRDCERLMQVRVGASWVEVSTAENVFRSRVVVGADGAYSVVARELGMEIRAEYVAGIESEVVVSGEKLAKWKSQIQMELGCVPGGYGWVFPKRTHLSIGVGCLASKARHLSRHHDRFLNSLDIGRYTILRTGRHLIPTCMKGMVVCQDKALLVGDAAGLADPLTGEGIYNAIRSAQLAAPVIEDFLLQRKAGLADYQQAVDERIRSELRIARTLSRLFIRFPHLAFRLLDHSEGAWRAGCSLVLGEIDYARLTERAGGLKGILSRLFQA